MFHFNKHLRCIFIVSIVVILFTTSCFAQSVSDADTHTKLQNIYDRLFLIYSTQTYTNDSLDNIYSRLATTNSAIGTSNGYLSSIVSNTNNLSTISTKLSDLNNVDWTPVTGSFLGFYNSPGGSQITNYNTRINAGTPIYVAISQQTANDRSLFKLTIPLIPQSAFNYNRFISSIEFYNASGSLIPDPQTYIEYIPNANYVNVFIYNFQFYNNATVYIKFSFNNDYRYLSSGGAVYYISDSSTDYYLVSLFGGLNQLNESINDFKEVYLSEDIIAAKENQQQYEDQVIDDFTGSGSAAASGSDATSLKNISGSLKSGLNSGGSVSNALGVFNNSSDLWKWFSQDNYNDINGQPSRSDDGIIDFYNINQRELQELLNDSDR